MRIRFMLRGSRNLGLCLVIAACADSGMAGGPGYGPSEPDSLFPRTVSRKPTHAVIPPDHSHRRIHVKFHEGTTVRLRSSRWVSLGSDDLRALQQVMVRYPGTRIDRLFTRPEEELAWDKVRIEAKSGREQADLNLYYVLTLEPGVRAEAVIDDLNALVIVEIAYAEALPAPPPLHASTPDFSDEQDYMDPAPDGIDVGFASRVCGGRGDAVKVIDIEYSWNDGHEDLGVAAGQLIPNPGLPFCSPSDPFNSTDHGTAVLGEMVGEDNGFGVTGIVFEADVGMVNSYATCTILGLNFDFFSIPNAINLAHGDLTDGDLIIIEQQTAGPLGCSVSQFGCVAVEWVQATYDAIVSATSDGIIVVEAAGNGSQDLGDTSLYGNPFPSGRPDSGAIIVGAGRAPGTGTARERLGFSTFGPRVNLQGWGNAVVTTGYGDHPNSPTPAALHNRYTHTFGGTSSASPIVTGAAASLSSVSQTLAGVDLTSTQVRSLLMATGTPQDTSADTGNIGPLPDLAQALLGFDTDAPDVDCPADVIEECTSPSGKTIDYTATVTDNCDGEVEVSCAPPSGATFPIATTNVECSSTDASGNDGSCDFDVTVQDTTDPDIVCPADIVVECTGNCGVEVGDPQLSPFFAGVSATDICDPTPTISHDAPALLPLGATAVTFTAVDNFLNDASCTAMVTVQDTIDPTIDVVLDRETLWAPNHKLVTIRADVEVSDICDPSASFVLTSITSDEPDDGLGDGSTSDDIQGADFGTPDVEFQLRAERQGGGDGRVYTIVYTAMDKAGNSSQAVVEVLVEHDQSE